MKYSTYHYLIIGKETNHLIWEGIEENDLLNYDISIDVLLLINYKNEYKNFSIPDNFLYLDYELEEPKEKNYQLIKWDNNKKEYIVVFDTESVKNSNNKSILNKKREIDDYIYREYISLMDFSKKLVHEITNSRSIEKLYEIANDSQNQYSKIAKFILLQANNKDMDNEKLIAEYGCIRKTTNMLGIFLTSLKNETENAAKQIQEKR